MPRSPTARPGGPISRRRRAGTFVRSHESRGALQDTVVLLIRTTGHLYDNLSAHLVQALQAGGYCPVILDSEATSSVSRETLLSRIAALAPKAVVVDVPLEFPIAELKQRLPSGATLIELLTPVSGTVTPGAFRVTSDFFAGGHESARHLLGQGCRRPVLVDALYELPPHYYPGSAHHQYNLGYRRALEEAGLAGSERFFFNSHESANDAARIQELLTAPGRPDGILALGDFRAVQVIRAATALGLKIPDDLALIGYYNTPWCEMIAPPLASVSIEPAAFAAAIARTVANPKGVSPITKIPPRLVIRRSADRKTEPTRAAPLPA